MKQFEEPLVLRSLARQESRAGMSSIKYIAAEFLEEQLNQD